MDDFVSYLLSEFQLPPDVVCYKTELNYSQKNSIDKKSHVPITHNVIVVKIDCFDKTHTKLASVSERFVDGRIKRPKNKKLVNISPDELNNKFNAAKACICSRIMKTNTDKVKELEEVLADISRYCSNEGVIPNEYIREPIVTREEPEKNRKQFEF